MRAASTRATTSPARGLDTPGPGGFATGDNEWGWGVQAGVKLNLPTANTVGRQGRLCLGLGRLHRRRWPVLQRPRRRQQRLGPHQKPRRTSTRPATTSCDNGDTEKTKAFNANLGALHYWSPQWRSTLQGTYISVDYRKVNADWKTGAITGNLIWTPVKKLDIGAELVYIKILDKANVAYTGARG